MSRYDTFLNKLSFRDLTSGSPNSQSGIEVDDSIQSSREKIANLRDKKINDLDSNFSRYNFIDSSLFDNENPPPRLTTLAMGEEDDSLPPPDLTTLAMGEEDDSLPPFYDNYIDNYDRDKQIIKGSEGNDLINSFGNKNNINSGRGDDLIYNDGNMNRIITGAGADQVFSNGRNNTIRTGSGDDYISLGFNSGGSKINAGRGDDNILVNEQSQGSISIKGGSGNDTVTIEGDESDYKLSIDSKTGNRKYIHKTNGSEINIAKDVENIDFRNYSPHLLVGK